MEQTYVMVKPDGVQRGLIGEVISRIEKRGLKIVALKMNVISEDTAKEHYAEHAAKPFFSGLVEFITSGPSVSMVVEGKDAIRVMRAINGATNPVDAAPGTIRGDFALDVGRNVVHASDSPDAAAREIAIHFKDSEIGKYSRIDEVCLYE
ncbi:MAG: nucleoside-diphosphate kinase [Methanosarcina thermophila]|jgi:nucleoside-diphosphate kinase|uniref:Nucleoside diphosphate kinase n=3 Tax=Methanosarcina thermophila TaxID=2210 RepID=A0A1I6Y3E0_METTE|nr:nucleoside-diphosphate kinase [Methanosarcina thermophila]ALK05847.1 MAG: nucleoside diphosphate kinase [Methanosarcina sp. 795]AKB16713.1 Nucleoside diphosphate kinase [Methanosarcina thermophila CHTI-55]NLU57668.1 nucleoside-diphosphate kinase [Methanosarcina thermophila]SFT44903.1 nucleoside diphosphate kinase [Methanosarcina thermophila]BAW30357.1 nucleoside diphosphate kinase [Methanosarcina thermophila]